MSGVRPSMTFIEQLGLDASEAAIQQFIQNASIQCRNNNCRGRILDGSTASVYCRKNEIGWFMGNRGRPIE